MPMRPEPRIILTGDKGKAELYRRRARQELEILRGQMDAFGRFAGSRRARPEAGVSIECRSAGGSEVVRVDAPVVAKPEREEFIPHGVKFKLYGYGNRELTASDVHDTSYGVFMVFLLHEDYRVGDSDPGQYRAVPQSDMAYLYGAYNKKPVDGKVAVGFESGGNNWFIDWGGIGGKYAIVYPLQNWKHYYHFKAEAGSLSPVVLPALPGYWDRDCPVGDQEYYWSGVPGGEGSEFTYTCEHTYAVAGVEGEYYPHGIFHHTAEDFHNEHILLFAGEPATEDEERHLEITRDATHGMIRGGADLNLSRSCFNEGPVKELWESSHPIEWIWPSSEGVTGYGTSWSQKPDFVRDSLPAHWPLQKTYILLPHVAPSEHIVDTVNSSIRHLQVESVVGLVFIPRSGWVKRTLLTTTQGFTYQRRAIPYFDSTYHRWTDGNNLGDCFSFLQHYAVSYGTRSPSHYDQRQFRLGAQYLYDSDGDSYSMAYQGAFDPKCTIETPVRSERIHHPYLPSWLEHITTEEVKNPFIKISTGAYTSEAITVNSMGEDLTYTMHFGGDLVVPISYFYERADARWTQEQEGPRAVVWGWNMMRNG